jgi:hypothetical protein
MRKVKTSLERKKIPSVTHHRLRSGQVSLDSLAPLCFLFRFCEAHYWIPRLLWSATPSSSSQFNRIHIFGEPLALCVGGIASNSGMFHQLNRDALLGLTFRKQLFGLCWGSIIPSTLLRRLVVEATFLLNDNSEKMLSMLSFEPRASVVQCHQAKHCVTDARARRSLLHVFILIQIARQKFSS